MHSVFHSPHTLSFDGRARAARGQLHAPRPRAPAAGDAAGRPAGRGDEGARLVGNASQSSMRFVDIEQTGGIATADKGGNILSRGGASKHGLTPVVTR